MINEAQENKLSDLQALWEDKGRDAGERDTWMTPCVKEVEGYSKKDDVDIVSEDHENWEGTDHFNVKYRKGMTADIDMVIDKEDEHYEGEDWIDAYNTVLQAFWQGYDETSKIYDMVKKERKDRKRLKVKI